MLANLRNQNRLRAVLLLFALVAVVALGSAVKSTPAGPPADGGNQGFQVALPGGAAPPAAGSQVAGPVVPGKAIVSREVKHDTSPPLSEMPPVPPSARKDIEREHVFP